MPGNKKITLFYHHPCLDGDMAMYVAYKTMGDSAHYIPLNHGNTMEDKILNAAEHSSILYFTDIAPERETLDFLLQREGKQVVVLDHHLTAITKIDGLNHPNLVTLLDKSKKYSGAGLAWQYFVVKPGRRLDNHENIEEMVRQVEVIDLNQTGEPNFYDIANFYDTAYTNNIDTIIREFDRIANIPNAQRIAFGARITASLRNAQDMAFRDAEVRFIGGTGSELDGQRLLLIPANLQELGRELFPRIIANFPGFDIVGTWFRDAGGTYRLSLRRNNDTLNIAEFAEALGRFGESGGGHEDSAGVQFNRRQFETIMVVDPAQTTKLRQKRPGRDRT